MIIMIILLQLVILMYAWPTTVLSDSHCCMWNLF